MTASQLPEHIVHQVRRCLLDYLGSTLAGAKMLGKRGVALLNMLENIPPPIHGLTHNVLVC